MPQALEYPYNGIVVTEPLPGSDLGSFLDSSGRSIHRVRVLLDPRVISPSGTSADPNIPVTIDGSAMDSQQSVNARAIIGVANTKVHAQLTTTAKRRIAAVRSIAAAIAESRLRVYANPNVPNSLDPSVYSEVTSDGSNGFSVGLFQQQVGSGFAFSNSLADVTFVMNRANSASLFLDRLLAVTNWDTADLGTVIQTAQGSTAAALYTAQAANAEAVVAAVGFPPVDPTPITISTAVQNQLRAVADGCQRAAIGTSPAVDVQIEWALDASQWPTSSTTARRPWVSDLVDFWKAMHAAVGTHAATWGFSLLNNPTFTATSAANQDPHASMTAYANVTWSGGTDPVPADHQTACRWLETLTAQVRSALRTAGFTKVIAVPTMYAPGHLRNIALFHPNGPWINDNNVWYETSFYPARLDETRIQATYATYNSWAAGVSTTYQASWSESSYYINASGNTSVTDPEVLALPPQEALPADPNVAPVPVLAAPVITSVIPGPASLQVNWTPPPAPPGGPILGYTLTLTSTEPTRLVDVNVPTATQQTVLNLTNGVAYTVSVAAFNVSGTSAPSSTLATTPTANAAPIDAPVTPPPVTPTPPVITVEEPNTFAFYPVGVNDSQGVFSPSNWAGL
jgi:hypothetical protein